MSASEREAGAAHVIVVGAGNAALCAALASAEHGARVTVLERAPLEHAGGNTRFTAGAIRFVYEGVEQLRELMPDLTDAELAQSDFGTYTEADFCDDMSRTTDGRADPELVQLVVTQSRRTLLWMAEHGIRFVPMWGRQAFKSGGRFRFWGGVIAEAWGGGEGLYEGLTKAVAAVGVEVRYATRAISLVTKENRVVGVRVVHEGRSSELHGSAVVLASGGFEANTQWRAAYLGPGWDTAKVIGTRFNSGDGIRMAIDVDAASHGNWSCAHAVGWDANAPDFGDVRVGTPFERNSYPFGILLNNDGRRFVDEGSDFQTFTYAKCGRQVLAQPGHVAWQVFDAKVDHLLADSYRSRFVTKVVADSIDELCARLEGVDSEAACQTIAEYNDAVRDDMPFDPTIKDGRRTDGLRPPKSNWSNRLDTPPFKAFQIACGITFTFGGLRVDRDCRVLDTDLQPIAGLYAAGEIVGGLFYGNCPVGTGLMSGSVLGRTAGARAAGIRESPPVARSDSPMPA